MSMMEDLDRVQSEIYGEDAPSILYGVIDFITWSLSNNDRYWAVYHDRTDCESFWAPLRYAAREALSNCHSFDEFIIHHYYPYYVQVGGDGGHTPSDIRRVLHGNSRMYTYAKRMLQLLHMRGVTLNSDLLQDVIAADISGVRTPDVIRSAGCISLLELCHNSFRGAY